WTSDRRDRDDPSPSRGDDQRRGARCVRQGAAAPWPSVLFAAERAALTALRRSHTRLAGPGDAVLSRTVRKVSDWCAAQECSREAQGLLSVQQHFEGAGRGCLFECPRGFPQGKTRGNHFFDRNQAVFQQRQSSLQTAAT